MDDSDNMSADDSKSVDSWSTIKTKPKKRSLVERELETNLTARVTSPVANADSTSLSRYGRARRLKTQTESTDTIKLDSPKSSAPEKSPKVQSPVYKMHASNTPIKESPKKPELYLDNQIENIYQENISLSRFATEEVVTTSPLKKIPKVYIQKDLIQRKDTDDPILLIKSIFSPEKSSNKLNSHLSNILERAERFNVSKQNGYTLENSSVVKTLDFDSKKKKKENKDKLPSKNELFELEAKCMFQVGDLAWARMGTYPFWPCIITRDPDSGMFVKKKLFGRVEHDIIHVTFFGDNGRRSWIVDNMLRNFTGLAEFEATRELFTVEDKKRDPRLYAAFFISEKKQALWKVSVDEAETLFREPKRLRIDMFNDMLERSRIIKTTPKVQKKVARTDSDVSLSESLYDSLFSEDDGKVDDTERSRNKSRNKSLDVSDVVTACLDNMAAKTGITKIQKQSHMDRWLQKAKSQTPEKVQVKTQVVKVIKINNNKRWKILPKEMIRPYSLRSGNESLTLLFNQNEHDYSKVLPEMFKDETKNEVTTIESVSNSNTTSKKIETNSIVTCSNGTSSECESPLEKVSKLENNCNEVDKAVEQTNESVSQIDSSIEMIEDINTVSKETNNESDTEVFNELAKPVLVNDIESNLSIQLETQKNNLPVISDAVKPLEVGAATTELRNDEQKSAKNVESSEIQKETKSPIYECLPFEADAVSLNIDRNNKPKIVGMNTTDEGCTVNDNDNKMEVDLVDSICSEKDDTNLQKNEVNLPAKITNTSESSSHNKDLIGYENKVEEQSIKNLSNDKSGTDNGNKQCVNMQKDDNDCEANYAGEEPNKMEVETAEYLPIEEMTNVQDNCSNNIATTCETLNTTSDRSIHISTETNRIDDENKTVTDIKTNVIDEDGANNLIMEKNSETEIASDSDTELPLSDATVVEDNSENCKTESSNSGIPNTTLKTLDKKVNDNEINKTILQEEYNNDSNNRPFEENMEAKVGTCNSNILNNCNITEDNFLNCKSNADNFVFLDKSAKKSIDLSKDVNGHLNHVNFIQDVNKKNEDSNTIISSKYHNKYTLKKLVNGDYKHKNLIANEEKLDNIIKCMTEYCDTKRTACIEIGVPNKTKQLDKPNQYLSKPDITPNISTEINIDSVQKMKTDALVMYNDSEAIECTHENNLSKANILHLKDNGNLMNCYSLNSPDKTETDVNLNTSSLLDINIGDSLNENAGTRNFLDNLNSLELAICNDIAKLGAQDSVSPLTSPKINDVQPKAINNDNKIKDKLVESINNDTGTSIGEQDENNTNIQNDSKQNTEVSEETELNKLDSNTMTQKIYAIDSVSDDKKDNKNNSINNNEDSKIYNVKINKCTGTTIENNLTVKDNTSLDNNLDDSVLESSRSQSEIDDNKVITNRIRDDQTTELGTPKQLVGDASVSNDKEKNNDETPVLKIHNKLLENVKESHCVENGYHDSDSPDLRDSDDDFDIDAVSVNSEDSAVSLNKTDKHYKRKLRATADKPLEDPDFLRYLEMRQDSLIDEHPGLTDDEIISYLYKTYLYEESQKSDIRKTDDADQSVLVKGLNEHISKKHRVSRSVRDSMYQKKKKKLIQKDFEKTDTASVTSDSDISWTDKQLNKPELMVTMSDKVNSKGDRLIKITKVNKQVVTIIPKTATVSQTKQTLLTDFMDKIKTANKSEIKIDETESKTEDIVKNYSVEVDSENASIVSDEMEVPLLFRKTRSRDNENSSIDSPESIKYEVDKVSISPEKAEITLAKRKKVKNEKRDTSYTDNPEFVQYLELRQDALIDENPQLTSEEISFYLYKTWLYEEDKKSDQKKADEIKQSGIVKGLNQIVEKKPKIKKKLAVDKEEECDSVPREKPRRKASKPFYNEEYSDIEEELEVFEIFKKKSQKRNVDDANGEVKTETEQTTEGEVENEVWENEVDEAEYYFEQLTKPKPNIFKGLIREKVCEVCETANNLIKCKSCHGMFHVECVRKAVEVVKVSPPRSRKKKRPGRKPKNQEDSESPGDEKVLDVSEEHNVSIEDCELEPRVIDADVFEQQLSAKMKEVLDNLEEINYDSYSSDDGIDWMDTAPGKCEIVDVKFKRREKPIDYSDFKCNNCEKHDTPVCFVCKAAASKTGNEFRQKCNVAHCHKYYHLECLDHWPQSQFNAGEPSKNNKKINKHFEALTCPRHVCHTCVSDDPRGCKTRFSGDKLARCVRCPATYHSFTKCVPAGTKILTGSHVICPRHYEYRPGKVPCHVNTGWCFICALGGTLICCEYCPTSFHAECLNIDPPEGGYMCEDCETGRLPLYGEMVWVKLGNYRWWPGLILHPSEIPENLLSVRHSLGEFVVRFFGQYDYYWVNRGRVFPFQEGDSGRISSQKSKIDAAFTTAMEHAQRACEILKLAEPNEEESMDIASSLLPPHYVKLKTNKPIGSVCLKKVDDPELSLTQCECDPNEEDPCGPYSQCLNRVLLTECGPTCRAGDRCNNRAFEKRLYPKLTPYRTHHRGWGLKTLEDIKAGQFVIEYVGELIDEEEFQRRMRRKHEIRDENYYFLTLDKERMIDAGPKGNLARFMNHCCEPNCETQKWTVLGDVRVGLFALHDIPANSEVTFNYNLECAGIEKKRCLCGAKRCSGYMGAKPKQEESQPKKNKLQPKRTYKKRKVEISPTISKKQKRLGRPPKTKELTEIEKDLLIIKSATNLSSDDSDIVDKPKALKRKRVSFSSEDRNSDGSCKRSKTDVGD